MSNMRMRCRRGRSGGYILIKTMGFMLVTMMISVLAVDMGLYFSAQNRLQTAADAGALAGAAALFKSDAQTPEGRQDDAIWNAVEVAQANAPFTTVLSEDASLGYIDVGGGIVYDSDSFLLGAEDEYAFTGGYNAMQMTVWSDQDHDGLLSTIFGRLVQVDSMETVAQATAVMDDQINEIESGVRPVYGCLPQFEKADEDGNLSNDVVRIYGQQFMLNGSSVDCPVPGPGNWGFADFDNSPGAPGVATLRAWWANGYPSSVYADEDYSTQPGNPIASIRSELDTLINNKTVIIIPLATDFSGSGSSTQVHVAAFTGFIITGYQATGPAANRYIQGYFTRASCTTTCRTDSNAEGGGVVKLRLVGTH